MNLIADLHMHTMVSHHAYSSLQEMVAYAAQMNLQAIAITDHAPGMSDSANEWHFGSMWVVPRKIDGVHVLRGAELNIKDYNGTLDLPNKTLEFLDIVIASLHSYAIDPAEQADHMRAYRIVCENSLVDIIGHPTGSGFDFDCDELAKLAAATGTALELNSHALKRQPDTLPVYERLIEACLREGTWVSVASDAHISYEIAAFDPIPDLLDAAHFPPEQVVNSSMDSLNRFLRSRGSAICE